MHHDRERIEPSFLRGAECEKAETLEPDAEFTARKLDDYEQRTERADAASGILTAIVFLLFRLPGKIINWVQYMWPSRGDIWASRRRYGDSSTEIMYSIGVWAFVVVIVLVNLSSK
ncbi:hypothetical protein CL689_03295 [Candidatus Saccharibacteria bacterium]|nr:hypothetical protein [Candidatus Saccharibacteria bacterium]